MKSIYCLLIFSLAYTCAYTQSAQIPNDGCGNPQFVEIDDEVPFDFQDADWNYYVAANPNPHGFISCINTSVYTIKDIWFRFTAPANGVIQVNADSEIAIYTQCLGRPIECTSGTGFFENLVPGASYLLCLYDYENGSSIPDGKIGTLSINSTIPFQPECSLARITEIHYDNTGDDFGEFIEVTALGGESLAGYTVEFHPAGETYPSVINYTYVLDGNSTTVPNTEITIDTILFPESYELFGFTFESYLPNSATAISLRDPSGKIVDLISYEGVLNVDGFSSYDIGVQENSADPIDMSLRSQDIVGNSQWARSTARSPNSYNTELPIIGETGFAVWKGGSGNWQDSNWELADGTSSTGLRIFDQTMVSIPSGTVSITNTFTDNSTCYSLNNTINETYIKNLTADGIVVIENSGALIASDFLAFNNLLDISTAITAPSIEISTLNLGNGKIEEVEMIGDVSITNAIIFEIDGLAGQGVSGGHDFLNIQGDFELNGIFTINISGNYPMGTILPLISYESFDQVINDNIAPTGWIFENDVTAKTISLVKSQRPINDLCNAAINVPVSNDPNSPSISATTNEFSSYDLASNCEGLSNSVGVWYNLSISENSTYTLTASNASSNVTLQLFEGDCNVLNTLLCGQNEISSLLESSKTYHVLASTNQENTSKFDLTLIKYENPISDISSVGINTQEPITTLDINGSVRIGNDSTALPGVLRFTKNSFEGFTGSEWKSLDLSNDNFGNHIATTTIDVNGNAVKNVRSPIDDNDATNKSYVDAHEDGDADATNELQSLILNGGNLSLSDAAGSITLPGGNWSNLAGIPTGFSDNIDNVDDADNDSNNELISDIQLSGQVLSIIEGGSTETIDLSPLASPFQDLTNNEIHYSSGQVGIGVSTSINDRMHIRSTTGENALRVQVGNATKLRVYANGGIALGSNPSNIGANNVYVADTMGIGTVYPEEKLHVNGGVIINKNSSSGNPNLLILEDDQSTEEDFVRLYMQNGSGNRVVLSGRPRSNTSLSTLNFFLDGSGDVMKIQGNERIAMHRATPLHPLHIGDNTSNGNGAHLTSGGSWTNGSSRSFKTNFEKVAYEDVLQKLASLDILHWNYKDSKEGKHMGPIAEEFYKTFELGGNEKYISTVDADGVALAAIKALYQENQELKQSLDAQNSTLQERMNQQAQLVQQLIEKIKLLEKALEEK
jgi:hypothetical protein